MTVHNDDMIMMDALLVKLMLNEASEAERTQVKQWLLESEDNRKYFEHFQLIWKESKAFPHKTEEEVDENEAWNRFQQRIKTETTPIQSKQSKYSWLKIAAIFIVMLGAGLLYYFMSNKPETITVYAYDNVLQDTLPDGSIVTLNKNASVSYPKKFIGDTRNIHLTGEAFFKVTPNKQQPFIVSVNDITVKVVGTSFNIKDTKSSTEVIVETGIVEVAKKASTISLHPKERTIITNKTTILEKEKNLGELYSYYRTKEFVCNETPLSELVKKLNEAYNANIVIENTAIANLPLTTTFQNNSLDVILEVVSKSLKITYEKTGNKIILK